MKIFKNVGKGEIIEIFVSLILSYYFALIICFGIYLLLSEIFDGTIPRIAFFAHPFIVLLLYLSVHNGNKKHKS